MSSGLPPGIVPNYVDPPSIGWKVVDATAVSLAFAIVFVFLRLMTKLFVTHAPGWDDWTSIMALLLAIGRAAGCFVIVTCGIGLDMWNIKKSDFQCLTTLLAADDIMYIFGIMFAKLSILILYYRIFHVDQYFRYTVWVLSILVVGYCTALGLAKIFRCSPVKAVWDSKYKGPEHCADHIQIDFVGGWFNIFTDLAIFIMPAPIIWKLHLAPLKKLGVAVIFLFGAFAVAMSITRQATLYQGHDTKWTLAWNIMIFTLELNIGIICGCLPVLQPLITHTKLTEYLPSSIRSFISSRRSKGSYREQKGYVKRSPGSSDPSTDQDIELGHDKNPIVSYPGFPSKDSDDDFQHSHRKDSESHGWENGIVRTDRIDIQTDEKV